MIISGNLSGNRNKIHLLINNSTGGNISFESKLTLFSPDGSTAIRLAVHDLNGDGKSDIVVVDRENNKVFVFRNISTSGVSFDTPLEIVVNGAVKFWGLEVQDMDGDVAVGPQYKQTGQPTSVVLQHWLLCLNTHTAS